VPTIGRQSDTSSTWEGSTLRNVAAVGSGSGSAAGLRRQGFVRTYIFSLDHKVIGIQYAVTGLLFLLFG